MPRFRPAGPDDAPRIAEIYNAGIAERSSTFETRPREPAEILAWLKAGERFPVLAAVGEDVLGWARLAGYSERVAYAGVGEVSIYVDHHARGQGVGTRAARPTRQTGRRAGLLDADRQAPSRERGERQAGAQKRLAGDGPTPAPREARRPLARRAGDGAAAG